MRGTRTLCLIAAGCAVLGTACSSGSSKPAASKIVWPAPADAMARARDAGLVPETAERLTYHVHAHLDVFVNGQKVVVPAGIGINIHDPGVHLYPHDAGATGYGGINPPCATPCISPLHTHDVTGIIHTESSTVKDNTLRQLFVEWGVKLDANCVNRYCRPVTKIAIYVNGNRFTGDPRPIALSNRKEIAIVIGTPPAQIPKDPGF
jgi:hypothetical protein